MAQYQVEHTCGHQLYGKGTDLIYQHTDRMYGGIASSDRAQLIREAKAECKR